MKTKIPYKIIILAIILSTGVFLHQLGFFDWRLFISSGEKFAHTWWFGPSIITAKVILYMLALPGSTLIWLTGLFYNPVISTIIIAAGGTGGAVAAYLFSRSMSTGFTEKIKSSRSFSFLSRHTDMATLCALRTLPNFPHSVINYGAGTLSVPLPRFILSTTLGFFIKGYLYSSMIRYAVTAESISEVVNLKTIGPLFIISLLFIIGKLIQQYAQNERIKKRNRKQGQIQKNKPNN